MADISVLNIRSNELIHCNFCSFSRTKKIIFPHVCKKERENFVIVKGKQEINKKELKGQL